LQQRGAGFLEAVLRLFSLGEVSGDLGEANEFAGRTADWVDNDIGPEAGAVLADAPTFAFEFSLAPGGL